MDHSFHQIFKIFLNISKKHETVTCNPSIMIFVNKMENRTTFKIKTEYYLQLLTFETKRLLGSTKSELTIDKNGENVAHLETTEVILVHCNIVNNNYQQGSRVLYTFVPKTSFGQLSDISTKNFISLKNFN